MLNKMIFNSRVGVINDHKHWCHEAIIYDNFQPIFNHAYPRFNAGCQLKLVNFMAILCTLILSLSQQKVGYVSK